MSDLKVLDRHEKGEKLPVKLPESNADRIDFIVPQTDDPKTLAFTFRSFVLGSIWGIILSLANATLAFRTNSFKVSPSIAVLLSYPLGLLWYKLLPFHSFFNPGPFTMKEHVIIFVIASTSHRVPYGIDNVVAQVMPDMMNNTSITFLQSLSFVLVSQFLGYGLSGLCRRFLVKPTGMWWPGNLSTIALFVSFHKVNIAEVGKRFKMSRYVFFWVAFAIMFFYTWIPEYFFPVLQAASLMCMIVGAGTYASGVMSPVNAVASSVTNGVGVFGLTFDWQYIGSINITSPFWAVLVNSLGAIFFQWILSPWFFASDVWSINSKISEDNLNPLVNSPHLFCGNNHSATHKLGEQVRPTFFYDAENNYNLNMTAYQDVAPVHITSFFALNYASCFLTISAVISHVLIWHGSDIYHQFKNALSQLNDDSETLDSHSRLMLAYPDVPDWAYLLFLTVCTVAAIFVSLFTPFEMPWWAVLFNVLLCALFILPVGVIEAISGYNISLNVLTEFVIGLIIPGQTVAVMAFKSLGTNNIIQALHLVQDLKLGHYLHIPPYAMVVAQLYGTLLNAIIATAASWFMMFNTKGMLNPLYGEWKYVAYQMFYAAGGIWGAIGPERFFGVGSIYEGLLWCFPVGFIIPVIPWALNRYVWKSKYWQLANFAIFCTTKGPQSGYQNSIIMPLIVSFIVQVYIFGRNNEWYKKYTYVMGAAFDGASAFATVLISMLAMNGIKFKEWNYLNPNLQNVPLDYYCYSGANFSDYDCDYYAAKNARLGLNFTSGDVRAVGCQ